MTHLERFLGNLSLIKFISYGSVATIPVSDDQVCKYFKICKSSGISAIKRLLSKHLFKESPFNASTK